MVSGERRPIVLTFARYYLPGYKAGGPIRTISNLVEALGDEIDFRIVTSDRDANDPAPYPDVPCDGTWKKVGKADVLYLSPQRKGILHLGAILRDTPHDTLYLNSFFDPVFTLRPLLARRLGLAPKTRCVIAPRGEFGQGALSFKSCKKKAYLIGARAAGLYRDLRWQASSDFEAADIVREFGGIARNICIAVNLPDNGNREAASPYSPRGEGEPLRICFLSRISPEKNLDFALKVLRDVNVPALFDIYGLIVDKKYWNHCCSLIEVLPSNIQARYHGSVDYKNVPVTLGQYDLFLLPTRGENFGHAILDALAAGTPVLISDRTPWRGLARSGAGWDLPLEHPSRFVECIDGVFHQGEAILRHQRRCSKAFAQQRQNSVVAVAESRALLCRIDHTAGYAA